MFHVKPFLMDEIKEGDASGSADVVVTTDDKTQSTDNTQSTIKISDITANKAPTSATMVTKPDVAPKDVSQTKSVWPDNWRDIVSKGDAKLAARFGRYASPEVALTALIAAQNKISSGELKTAIDKTKASSEEMAAWRAENNIPEAPDKYEIKLTDGFVIGNEDKPFVDEFLKAAYASDQTSAQVNAALNSYYQIVEKQTADRASKDQQQAIETEEALRAEWGQDYRRNVNLIHGLLDTTSPNFKEKFLASRLPDGTPIFSDPEMLKFMIDLSLIQNPTMTVVPNNGGNMMKGIEDRIAEIQKVMNTNRAAYNKDEKMQAEYRQLLDAQAMNTKRAA